MSYSSIERTLQIRKESIPPESILEDWMIDSSIIDVSNIPVQCGLLSTDEIRITEDYTSVELLLRLSKGELTSEQVIRAYLKRAGIAHQLTNCATEFLGKEAIERAQYLDQEFKRRGGTVGPLHGLPISLKDMIPIKGRRNNTGFIKWLDRIAEDDALILKILSNAGAVFYIRTTQPQSLMHVECDCPVFGITVNPFNRNLSSGGSTGGEGALIALKGSLIGIGTDIGGSIRVPAAYNGIYGFKPTTFRLPMQGLISEQIGRESIIPVIGPLTRSREDIQLFIKIILDSEPWLKDPSLVPIPWRTIQLNSNHLTVAVMWDDNVVHPHPPIHRALQETVQYLQKSGIRILNWEPIDHQKGWDIISALYYCNGGEEERNVMSDVNEQPLPLTNWILNQPNVRKRTWMDMNTLIGEREMYRINYARIWNEREISLNCSIDCLLTPAGPSVASIHGTSKWWGYTSVWNLLDYPSVIFPVTTVDLVKDQLEIDYKPRNTIDEENYQLYSSPSCYANAPVGLQIVGRRYNDEKVIKCLEIIEQALGRK